MTTVVIHKIRRHQSGVRYHFGKHAAAKKVEIDYESDPPSCRNCFSLQKKFRGDTNSPPRPDYCLVHELLLDTSNGICKSWESPKGQILED